ncbi:phosphatase PAP2 family protein [Calothrix sp. HK-06]|nr:phosphatase PAP2 family protein [Calothrix sp. HK-06]
MVIKISRFWLHYIHPRLITLIGALGIGGLAVCLVILFVLAKLAEEVLERESFAFDKSILLWIRSYANPSLDNLMLFITQLGNSSVVVILAGITILTLLWRRYRLEAMIFVLTCLGAFILNTGLKLFFSKVRPQLWKQLIVETSYSFPSGHALGSMVLYGFIAYLLANRYSKYSKIIYFIAIILIGAIGLSRLYLGVHWPTDIIAGYGVGFLWLTICITMLKLQRLRQRQ